MSAELLACIAGLVAGASLTVALAGCIRVAEDLSRARRSVTGGRPTWSVSTRTVEPAEVPSPTPPVLRVIDGGGAR